MQTTRIYTILLAFFFFSATASAQVFDLGPSDPTLFTNVINLPGDDLPTSVGGVIGETTQVNVANGGVLRPSLVTASSFRARDGSEVNISGGTVEDAVQALSGSEINISGGSVHGFLQILEGSVLNISGGSVGDDLLVAGIVNISDGVVLGVFSATRGSEVNISGGSVGDEFYAFRGSLINISGGSVGTTGSVTGLTAYDSSVINVSGGSVGDLCSAREGSEVNISGGTVGIYFRAREGSVVNISGGSVGYLFQALEGSEVNISGGSMGDLFRAKSSSNVNLFGSDFALDGVLLDNLSSGEAFTVLDRDVTLSGLLADGSAFSFDLNSVAIPGSREDAFDSSATLTVTLTSEVGLGDCNQDGIVNFLDIAPFIAILSAGDFLDQADINQDGIVDFLDINPFIALLSS